MVRRRRGCQDRRSVLRWPCCAWRLLDSIPASLRAPSSGTGTIPTSATGSWVFGGFGFFSRTHVISWLFYCFTTFSSLLLSPFTASREAAREKFSGKQPLSAVRGPRLCAGLRTTAVNVFGCRQSRGLAPRIVRLPATGPRLRARIPRACPADRSASRYGGRVSAPRIPRACPADRSASRYGAASPHPESRGLAPRIVRLLTTAATHPVARTCGGSPCNLRRGRPQVAESRTIRGASPRDFCGKGG